MTSISSRTRVLLISAGLLAAAILLVGVQAVAMHTLPLLSPSVVATVDLERTFNGLEEWSQAQASEGTLSDAIRTRSSCSMRSRVSGFTSNDWKT